ncbi:hypothetical protein M2427_006142 [Bradyrhizobium sp. BR13661]|jgi:hypothetical protein|nr:hypothetical protein [Bradyrhizobium sp. BR13661]
MTTWAVFGLAIAILCVALWFLLKRNTGVHRKTLPRIFELYDLITTPRPPSAYFQNFEQSLLEIPQKLKQFRDIERDLQGLDADGWAFLKSEVAPLLVARDPKRGWQALFDKLNQAKAFNHLKEAGYQNIRFVPPSAVRGQQTPDLQADGALCEVKTINISEVEADRRDGGGVGTSTDCLDEGFFRKLSSDLRKARDQMAAYGAGGCTKYIAYVIVNFDDSLHEYADRYRRQIDQFIASDPVPGLKVALVS